MKKFYSLLRAVLSQDMSLFKIGAKGKANKFFLPIILALTLMLAMGSYSYIIAEPLHSIGLTYVVITIFMFLVSVMTFFEGIYKSSGILFDSKDNELLFSLPIRKSAIFGLRVIKLLLFQFLYNLIFILPSLVVYAYFERPGISFYLMSALMLVLLPIIPTILSCILGYIIKSISSRFKAKKFMQVVVSIIMIILVFILSSSLESFMENIVQKAQSINDILTKIYYPIGAYIELIVNKFSIATLINLLLVNILPLIATIYLGSIFYFKIISRSKESRHKKKKAGKSINIKVSSQLYALVKKELKKYFSVPVYIINTLFGPILILIVTIALCFNTEAVLGSILSAEGLPFSVEQVYAMIPIIYVVLIVFVSSLTCITSSSISIEGANFNIIKYIPVKPQKIFLAKIITGLVVCVPLILISSVIFAIKFSVGLKITLLYIGYCILLPLLTTVQGLVINLKFPKLDASSETEIVKQSASAMISTWLGLAFTAISIAVVIIFIDRVIVALACELVAITLLCLVLWFALNKYGINRFKKMNV